MRHGVGGFCVRDTDRIQPAFAGVLVPSSRRHLGNRHAVEDGLRSASQNMGVEEAVAREVLAAAGAFIQWIQVLPPRS